MGPAGHQARDLGEGRVDHPAHHLRLAPPVAGRAALGRDHPLAGARGAEESEDQEAEAHPAIVAAVRG